MYQPLIPCPNCKRHVRAAEEQCPFCAAAFPLPRPQMQVNAPSGRLTRAAAFLVGASLTVAACGTDETGGGSSSSSGGNTADSGPDDDGGVIALYGDPPPQDAGPDDGGSGMPKYGAPPPPDGGTDAG